jgi:ATPase subunit of ABC transporter with duplicated ATPase domains
MLFVSHDRRFLAQLSNRRLELTAAGPVPNGGGYLEYVAASGRSRSSRLALTADPLGTEHLEGRAPRGNDYRAASRRSALQRCSSQVTDNDDPVVTHR